jgi:hypothetical protein
MKGKPLKVSLSAQYEHAWLLRAEGLKLREIGERMGVGKQWAHQMVMRQGAFNRLIAGTMYNLDALAS